MARAFQQEWVFQWETFRDDSLFLFEEWIHPATLADFRDKVVLDAGCGGGQHLAFIAPFVLRAVGVDLNTAEIANGRTNRFGNVEILAADIATISLEEKFDIVYSLGVVHHTDNPDLTVQNLKRHLKPGGRLILCCYSHEGNFATRMILEPVRRAILTKLSRLALKRLAELLTALIYAPVFTIYRAPLQFLPYYDYFENWRKLTFKRNLLNVFDKLNAPKTTFISKEQVSAWLNSQEYSDIEINHYNGVAWRASGIRKA